MWPCASHWAFYPKSFIFAGGPFTAGLHHLVSFWAIYLFLADSHLSQENVYLFWVGGVSCLGDAGGGGGAMTWYLETTYWRPCSGDCLGLARCGRSNFSSTSPLFLFLLGRAGSPGGVFGNKMGPFPIYCSPNSPKRTPMAMVFVFLRLRGDTAGPMARTKWNVAKSRDAMSKPRFEFGTLQVKMEAPRKPL